MKSTYAKTGNDTEENKAEGNLYQHLFFNFLLKIEIMRYFLCKFIYLLICLKEHFFIYRDWLGEVCKSEQNRFAVLEFFIKVTAGKWMSILI